MRDGLTSDVILLVVQGEYDLIHVLKPPDWGIVGEEGVPGKEEEVHEGTEMNCPAMAGALEVLAGPQAEVEPQDNKVSGVSGLLVRG